MDILTLQAENKNLRALLAAVVLDQGGKLPASDRTLLMSRSMNISVWRDMALRAMVVEVYPRKENDVQHNHEEELRGEVVLAALRAERRDTRCERGLLDQGLLPSYGKEVGDDVQYSTDH